MPIEIAQTISLTESWPARIQAGVPHAKPEELPGLSSDLKPGEAFTLTGEDSATIGFGLFDPENRIVRFWPAEAEESLDNDFFRRRVARAHAHRGMLGLTGPKQAYRLINNEGDGLSGFTVDVYAGHVVIFGYAKCLAAYFEPLAQAIDAELKPQSIVGKIRPHGETPTGRVEVVQLSGSLPPRQVIATEDEVQYEVHLTGGLNTGLFSDMRLVRRALRQYVHGKRVLNTFSYTGSFSVVAALAGARAVTSVDFAAGVLHWTKTNFILNSLPAQDSRFTFHRGDVFEYLKQTRRKDHEFDVVILDPPTATNVPGRRWFLKTDYDRLIAHTLRIMPVGGVLVVAASSLQSRPERLETQIRAAAKESGRRLSLLESYGLPPDFPTQMIHPESRYLKCYFLLIDR
jgi:23S rRNA (cytosine1962-C5)-methyltransferase